MLDAIKTESQYNEALARIYELMQSDVRENSVEFDELEILSIQVKKYETAYYPISRC